MPPPHPDQHSPRGNFWDCVSIPPGWEWCQGVNEGTLGRAGIAADRCWPGAFFGISGGRVLGVLRDICRALGRVSRRGGSRAVTHGDNLSRDCGR